MAIYLSACYVMQIYTNTMNYQNILSLIYRSGGPVVASSNLVIPTAEKERLTRKCGSFLFGINIFFNYTFFYFIFINR